MITLYVPLEPKGKARDEILAALSKDGLVIEGMDCYVITKHVVPIKTGDGSLNAASEEAIDVFATSSPVACGLGEIAPSRIAKTRLVIILDTTWGKNFESLLSYSVARNCPNEILALVRGWDTDIHETSLRGYIRAEYDTPLVVRHIK